jgi:hypothetical protein
MELSEFTPPSRQSMTDEEISQKLGSASADEAGMLAAMEFLETQTNLREQDNAAVATWLEKMNASDDPRAKVAIENFERAKLGLASLPLEQPIGSAEENAEAFEEMLQESLEVLTESAEVIEETPAEFETSVESHKSLEKPATGYRMVSAANWIIGVGVFAPAFAAVLANLMGMNFVTSILAGLVGILAGVSVNLIGLLTARRTHRGLAVASRSTFGVFGSIVPGITLVLSGLFALTVIAFGAATYLDGRVQGIEMPFTETLLSIGSVGFFCIANVARILVRSFLDHGQHQLPKSRRRIPTRKLLGWRSAICFAGQYSYLRLRR